MAVSACTSNKPSFDTIWQTDIQGANTPAQIKLPLVKGGEYNFVVNWGDGRKDRIKTWDDAKSIHTYENPGIYQISIKGEIIGWSFNNQGDCLKLTQISSWGNLKFGDTEGQLYGCRNLSITAEDVPDLTLTSSLKNMFRDCTLLSTVPHMEQWSTEHIKNVAGMYIGADSFKEEFPEWYREKEKPFISHWNDPGGIKRIRLPLKKNGNYNFLIDWGDGSSERITIWDSEEAGHTYRKDGNGHYPKQVTVSITGIISGWSFDGYTAGKYLSAIEQWGPLCLGDTEKQFSGCSKLVVTAGDAPALSRTKSLKDAFRDCIALVSIPGISSWDTSSVLDMTGMFMNAKSFVQDPLELDTSRVTAMSRMFYGAAKFNGDISSWDVSAVKDMSGMFAGAASFNRNISGWNTAQVNNMSAMFSEAGSFNGNISQWDVSAVTAMTKMFYRAGSFSRDLSNWDVASVKNAYGMFEGAESAVHTAAEFISPEAANPDPFVFTLNMAGRSLVTALPFVPDGNYSLTVDWGDGTSGEVISYDDANTSHKYRNSGLYEVSIKGLIEGWSTGDQKGSIIANSLAEIKNWGSLSFGNTRNQFKGCSNMKISAIDVPDLSKTRSLASAFSGCSALAGVPLMNEWDVSGIEDFSKMFENCYSFNEDISAWDMSNAQKIESMFFNAANYNHDLSGWNLDKLKNKNELETFNHTLFYVLKKWGDDLQNNAFVSKWKVGRLHYNKKPVMNINLPLVEDGTYNFLVSWGDGTYNSVSDYSSLLKTHTYGEEGEYEIRIAGIIKGWSFSVDINPDNYIIDGERGLVGYVDGYVEYVRTKGEYLLEISNWGPLAFGNTTRQFLYCKNLVITAQDIPDLTGTSSLTQAFSYCESLKRIPQLKKWDVSGIKDMSSMFEGSKKFNQDLSGWKLNPLQRQNLYTYINQYDLKNLPAGMNSVEAFIIRGLYFFGWSPNGKVGFISNVNNDHSKTSNITIVDIVSDTELADISVPRITADHTVSNGVTEAVCNQETYNLITGYRKQYGFDISGLVKHYQSRASLLIRRKNYFIYNDIKYYLDIHCNYKNIELRESERYRYDSEFQLHAVDDCTITLMKDNGLQKVIASGTAPGSHKNYSVGPDYFIMSITHSDIILSPYEPRVLLLFNINFTKRDMEIEADEVYHGITTIVGAHLEYGFK